MSAEARRPQTFNKVPFLNTHHDQELDSSRSVTGHKWHTAVKIRDGKQHFAMLKL